MDADRLRSLLHIELPNVRHHPSVPLGAVLQRVGDRTEYSVDLIFLDDQRR